MTRWVNLRAVLALCAFALIAATATSAGSVAAAQEPPRIVGGVEATLGQLPYQTIVVVFGDDGSTGQCGGSVLSTNVVLTAAHCLDGLPRPDQIRVGAGFVDLANAQSVGQVVTAASYTIHPNYSGNPPGDVAVIVLETPFVFGPNLGPIALATAADLEASTEGRISGWGLTADGSLGGQVSDVLMTAVVPIIPDRSCTADYPFSTPAQEFCAGLINMVDSCQGDSGGPLAVTIGGTPRVAGIVSYGGQCAGPRPGVYAEVPFFASWITDQVNAAAVAGPTPTPEPTAAPTATPAPTAAPEPTTAPTAAPMPTTAATPVPTAEATPAPTTEATPEPTAVAPPAGGVSVAITDPYTCGGAITGDIDGGSGNYDVVVVLTENGNSVTFNPTALDVGTYAISAAELAAVPAGNYMVTYTVTDTTTGATATGSYDIALQHTGCNGTAPTPAPVATPAPMPTAVPPVQPPAPGPAAPAPHPTAVFVPAGVQSTGHLAVAAGNSMAPVDVKATHAAPAVTKELAYTGNEAGLALAQWALMAVAIGLLVLASPVLRRRRN